MSAEDRERWDAKYAGRSLCTDLAPNEWLRECAGRHPPGRALDLATGRGHNAVWLAKQGWTVEAIDISAVAIQQARQLAQAHAQSVEWSVADLDTLELQAESYDLITVFRFLDRQRLPKLVSSALKPGGLLLYETFTTRHAERFDSMRNPNYLLDAGELPGLFPDLESTSYADVDLAKSSVARFQARKPTK